MDARPLFVPGCTECKTVIHPAFCPPFSFAFCYLDPVFPLPFFPFGFFLALLLSFVLPFSLFSGTALFRLLQAKGKGVKKGPPFFPFLKVKGERGKRGGWTPF